MELVTWGSSGAAEREGVLVAVPPAGASVGVFARWAEPARRAGWDLASPDWQPGDAAVEDTVAKRADALVSAVLDLGDRPTVVLGHSFGGLVAYEATRRLEEVGRAPLALVLCAARSPGLLKGDRLHDAGSEEVEQALEDLLPDDDPARRHPILRRLLVARLLGDIALARGYAHAHPLPAGVPTLLYRFAEDGVVPVDAVRGWHSVLTSVRERVLPGGHGECLRDPGFVRVLAADLAALSEARGRGRSGT